MGARRPARVLSRSGDKPRQGASWDLRDIRGVRKLGMAVEDERGDACRDREIDDKKSWDLYYCQTGPGGVLHRSAKRYFTILDQPFRLRAL